MGGSGKLWGVQARDAAAHGPPRGRVGDSLGSVSGEVSHSLRTTKFKSRSLLAWTSVQSPIF